MFRVHEETDMHGSSWGELTVVKLQYTHGVGGSKHRHDEPTENDPIQQQQQTRPKPKIFRRPLPA